MRKHFFILVFILLAFSLFTSCNKSHTYPCPGLGQMTEADLSQFDENGQLKDTKGGKKKKGGPTKRINHDSGLVNKKNPKGLKAPRKTQL